MPSEMATSIDKLREEILTEGRRNSEEILRQAHIEADNLLKKAQSDIDHIRSDMLSQARSDAVHRKELLLATVPVEAGRIRSSKIESLLEGIREEAIKQLSSMQGDSYRRSLLNLASDAINHMEGNSFVVHISEKDRIEHGDNLAREIERHIHHSPVEITIAYDTDLSGHGPIIEDKEGRQLWDNRFLSRLNRLWPDLRRRISLDAALVSSDAKTGEKT